MAIFPVVLAAFSEKGSEKFRYRRLKLSRAVQPDSSSAMEVEQSSQPKKGRGRNVFSSGKQLL